jgi:uncharacterized protein YkwD
MFVGLCRDWVNPHDGFRPVLSPGMPGGLCPGYQWALDEQNPPRAVQLRASSGRGENGRSVEEQDCVPRVRLIPAAALLVSGSALVFAIPASSSNCVGAQAEAQALSPTLLESSVTCLINEERAKAGLRSVRASGRLRQAALSHSQDMVRRGYFEHTSPSGETFVDRITAAGYTRGGRRWLLGENLIWGRGTESTPQAMVDDWMGSPPHRANLLRARFREIGVAAVRGTPVDSSDLNGVTVSSEYGFRKRIRPPRRR